MKNLTHIGENIVYTKPVTDSQNIYGKSVPSKA